MSDLVVAQLLGSAEQAIASVADNDIDLAKAGESFAHDPLDSGGVRPSQTCGHLVARTLLEALAPDQIKIAIAAMDQITHEARQQPGGELPSTDASARANYEGLQVAPTSPAFCVHA
jgi:hypothetical protein